MDWFDATDEYHRRSLEFDGELSALPEEWQRELAALWRLEADVNNGAYLQFLMNWGRECYVVATRALKKIGAYRMAQIVDTCQALVDEHFSCEGKSPHEMLAIAGPGRIIGPDGKDIEKPPQALPEPVMERILELSYEFMDYPDDLPGLGLRYYGELIEKDCGA
jgi:hypothetical protein